MRRIAITTPLACSITARVSADRSTASVVSRAAAQRTSALTSATYPSTATTCWCSSRWA